MLGAYAFIFVVVLIMVAVVIYKLGANLGNDDAPVLTGEEMSLIIIAVFIALIGLIVLANGIQVSLKDNPSPVHVEAPNAP